MEQIAVFEEKVTVNPIDLRAEITSFDTLLLQKLKKQLEGKCSKHGYVIKDSLELLSRSLGIVEKGHFTSDFIYYLKAKGRVYNPPDGVEGEGEVIKKNKMGLYIILHDAIRVMIPRDLHIGNDSFDNTEVGDRVRFEIKKSRFQVNDTHILSIGQYLGKVGEEVQMKVVAPEPLSPMGEQKEEEEEEQKEEDAEEGEESEEEEKSDE